MKITMDAAGRVVIPKPLREAMGLQPGVPVDMSLSDGRLIIEHAPADAETVVLDDGLPAIRVRNAESAESVTDEVVRATLEAVRR